MKNGVYLFLVVCALVVTSAHAVQVVAPDVQAKTVTTEVLEKLQNDKDIQAGDTRKAAEFVDIRLQRHFDFPTMTRLAMGKHWAQATPSQRRILTDEFRAQVVRTYTESLNLSRYLTVEYRPLKLAPKDTDAVVKSLIWWGSEPIPVDYRMEKTDDGWKVYDVKISGISLVENYRNVFNAEIRRSGIDGLIQSFAALKAR
jgi:phospholipid transport system substrate-binding protein